MSQNSSKKNLYTKNPLRKWEKKLRNAKTEKDKQKAQQMVNALSKKETIPKIIKQPTDNELIDQAIKQNKRKFKEKQMKELTDKKTKQLNLEKVKKRSDILSIKKQKENDKENEQLKEIEYREEYKKEYNKHIQQIKSHNEHFEKIAQQKI